MKLAFTEMGTGSPMVILHGLFGSSDNWTTLGKRIAETHQVFLVDQRNHGKSPHSDAFSYDLLAEDLQHFMEEQEITKATIVGHSMGGKTAMRFAQLFPERVEKLVVVDMGIRKYKSHHDDIFRALHAIDLSALESRKDADEQASALIPDFGTRQFLLKNLYRKEKDQFAWRINFPVLEAKMDEILAAADEVEVQLPILFIRGTRSDYIQDEDKTAIRKIFPRAQFANLQTGHWVHAEDPDGFYKTLMEFVTAS